MKLSTTHLDAQVVGNQSSVAVRFLNNCVAVWIFRLKCKFGPILTITLLCVWKGHSKRAHCEDTQETQSPVFVQCSNLLQALHVGARKLFPVKLSANTVSITNTVHITNIYWQIFITNYFLWNCLILANIYRMSFLSPSITYFDRRSRLFISTQM